MKVSKEVSKEVKTKTTHTIELTEDDLVHLIIEHISVPRLLKHDGRWADIDVDFQTSQGCFSGAVVTFTTEDTEIDQQGE